MKINFFSALAVSALCFLSSCSSDDATDSTPGAAAPEIKLSSGVTLLRSTYTGIQIAKGQQVGVFFSEDSASPQKSYEQNLAYSADGLGSLNGLPQYFPSATTGVRISAYHPYSLDNADNYKFTVAADQTDATNIHASDLLYSNEIRQAPTGNPVLLTFKHKLTRVTYTLTAGDGNPDLTDAQVTMLDALSTIEFNRKNGNLGTVSNKQDILLNNVDGGIVVPQVIASGTKFLKITLTSGKELYYTPTTNFNLDSGKTLHVNLLVNLKEAASIGSEIEDWDSSTSNGTAEEPQSKVLLPIEITSRVVGNHCKYLLEYDDNNRLISFETFEYTHSKTSDAIVSTIYFKNVIRYDENNLMLGHSWLDESGTTVGNVFYDYTTPGEVVVNQVYKGTTYFYFKLNNDGKVIEEYFPGTTRQSLYFEYDSKGNMIKKSTDSPTGMIYEYTFGTKNSILKNVNVPNWFLRYIFPFDYLTCQGPNDVTAIKRTGQNTVKDYPYTTTYNSSDYPTYMLFQIEMVHPDTGALIILDYPTTVIYKEAK